MVLQKMLIGWKSLGYGLEELIREGVNLTKETLLLRNMITEDSAARVDT